MFAQHRFIDPNHHVALESCIRNHVVVTAPLLARLYGAALANIAGAKGEAGFLTSHIASEDCKLGFATDEKTGIYIQLAQVKGRTANFLTVGQKWAVERDNAIQGNTSTTFW